MEPIEDPLLDLIKEEPIDKLDISEELQEYITSYQPQRTEDQRQTETTNKDKEKNKIKDKLSALKRKKAKLKKVKKKLKTKKKVDKKKKIKQKRVFLIPQEYKVSAEVEKMTKAIQYYACAVCDEKYNQPEDLQKHVVSHRDRYTSWDHKVKNRKLRKTLRKERKKLRNLKLEKQFKNTTIDDIGGVKIKKEVEDKEISETIEEGDSKKNLAKEINEVSEEISNILVQLEEAEAEKTVTKILKKKIKTDEPNNLEMIFKCGFCAKQFCLNYYLRLHVRSHTGEKPYACPDCPATFVTAGHLGRHRKRQHLQIKYECRICRKAYARLEFLQGHFNKHHQEDKIDGEPYDYNAILPYLKELEEDMDQKKRDEEEKERLRQAEELQVNADEGQGTETPGIADDADWKFEDIHSGLKKLDEAFRMADDGDWKFESTTFVDVIPTSPWSDRDGRTEERQHSNEEINEAKQNGDGIGMCDVANNDGFESDDIKDDNSCDEDYFPDETWVPPVDLLVPVKPKQTKRTYTKRQKDEPIKCPHCSKVIKSFGYLKIHIRTHTGDKPHECDICNKRFITASKLNRHLLTHSKSELMERAKKKIKKEKDIKKEDEGSKKCVKSDSTGRTRCVPDRQYACDHCNKKFVYEEMLLVHNSIHATEGTPVVCSYCIRQCDDLATLAAHEREHSGRRPYICTICGKTYTKMETMIYHRRTHKSDLKYQCEICPKAFDTQSKLERHLMGHRTEKFTMRYECPVCAHMFKTKWHIEMHLQSHEKEGVIQQENRGHLIAMVMQNARKIPLDTDLLTAPIPNDERSRICNICGEIFHHFFFLEQHLKSHGTKFSVESTEKNEERKHICPICNKGFKLRYYLKLHNYTHIKERPYICQQCGKGFITQGKLNRHLETHAGLKKYQCHICHKYFTRPSYLRIHVRTIHSGHGLTNEFKFQSSYEFSANIGPDSLRS